MGIQEKIQGELRYFTYYLQFPDGVQWQSQVPFVHDLSFEIKNMRLRHDPEKVRSLMLTGQVHWKDHNGVTHRIVVETEEKPRIWGNPGKGIKKHVRQRR